MNEAVCSPFGQRPPRKGFSGSASSPQAQGLPSPVISSRSPQPRAAVHSTRRRRILLRLKRFPRFARSVPTCRVPFALCTVYTVHSGLLSALLSLTPAVLLPDLEAPLEAHVISTYAFCFPGSQRMSILAKPSHPMEDVLPTPARRCATGTIMLRALKTTPHGKPPQ